MKKRFVVFSPHLDDAALCLGGLLASMARAGRTHEILLVNVFTDSCYTRPDFVVSDRSVRAISYLRAVEDALFCAGVSISSINLGFPDSSAIGLSDDEEIIQVVGDDTRLNEVAVALHPYLQSLDFAAVPLGVGNHIDHLIVREAAKKGLNDLERLIYFEDLPYSIGQLGAFESVAQSFLDSGWRTIELPIGDSLKMKESGLKVYSSQLDVVTISKVVEYASSFINRTPIERVLLAKGKVNAFVSYVTNSDSKVCE